jgi:hypothetical protein
LASIQQKLSKSLWRKWWRHLIWKFLRTDSYFNEEYLCIKYFDVLIYEICTILRKLFNPRKLSNWISIHSTLSYRLICCWLLVEAFLIYYFVFTS